VAEGVGLEPTSPFGQRFSSPSPGLSPSCGKTPKHGLYVGKRPIVIWLPLSSFSVIIRTTDVLRGPHVTGAGQDRGPGGPGPGRVDASLAVGCDTFPDTWDRNAQSNSSVS
jgi:hypothetical protein